MKETLWSSGEPSQAEIDKELTRLNEAAVAASPKSAKKLAKMLRNVFLFELLACHVPFYAACPFPPQPLLHTCARDHSCSPSDIARPPHVRRLISSGPLT